MIIALILLIVLLIITTTLYLSYRLLRELDILNVRYCKYMCAMRDSGESEIEKILGDIENPG